LKKQKKLFADLKAKAFLEVPETFTKEELEAKFKEAMGPEVAEALKNEALKSRFAPNFGPAISILSAQPQACLADFIFAAALVYPDFPKLLSDLRKYVEGILTAPTPELVKSETTSHKGQKSSPFTKQSDENETSSLKGQKFSLFTTQSDENETLSLKGQKSSPFTNLSDKMETEEEPSTIDGPLINF